ncbi:BAD_collapsed_G0027850.mRNA.1.CDS.1 [Saccharomyces cerevisiae]|nr:BAD_HP_G0058880.mRNA.1.CDS.1 [Saccharomyces cerevisiae]CAI6866441.1 BAD_HP_G0058880.mRNA.1.CDS.1 [Saccharomyces cerevisiae]CAI7249316.1 BAD_collapsed_G0027850.mRNA.1.CDS.1 [Saccharomyces cerevisiae]
MTFFLKRKISFFFVRHCTNFFISAYTLKQISHSCCLFNGRTGTSHALGFRN